jgi:hypothetical protein
MDSMVFKVSFRCGGVWKWWLTGLMAQATRSSWAGQATTRYIKFFHPTSFFFPSLSLFTLQLIWQVGEGWLIRKELARYFIDTHTHSSDAFFSPWFDRMPHSFGRTYHWKHPTQLSSHHRLFIFWSLVRARTRHMFSRNFREHGAIPLSTYLKTYKVGDIVDIKANAAVQKGMPHKFYHG